MESDSFYKGERFKLKGKRIILRPLRRDDIDKRLKWKKYPDPLYFHYNLSELTEAQQEEWYLKKKKDPQILYLAIDNLQGELLGFLSLFEINLKYKKVKLGIYLGYEFIDKGYGTEAIKTLLPYCFEKMKFEELSLDVATLNKRAIRCYLKCGFEFAGTKFNKHDPRSGLDIFGDERYRDIRKYFKKKGSEILVQFENMKLTEERWRNIGI